MPRKPDVPCAVCGKLLYSGKGCLPAGERTCRNCRRTARASGSPVGHRKPPRFGSCSNCGEAFELQPGRKRRTCSAACVRAIKDRYAHVLGDRRRTCEICGATFRYRHAAQRTCSRACGVELRRRTLRVRTCACGRVFEIMSASRGPRSCPACRTPKRPERRTPKRPERTCATCGSRYTGRSYRYCSALCWRDARRRRDLAYIGNTPERVDTCTRCGRGKPSERSRSKYCESCAAIRAREVIRDGRRRRKALKRSVVTEPYTLAEIAQRDRHMCGLCRKRVAMTKVVPHPKAPTIDHIVPLADDGDDVRANVQLAHFICNSRKSHHGTQQLVLIG